MDKIIIKGLEIFAHHGVFEEENTLGQKFIIDAELHISIREAGISDDINKSVDYGTVCADINNIMQEQNCNLIEAVAEKVATGILTKYPDIRAVELIVKKPWAPILMPIETVAVSIFRKKHIAYLGLGSNIGDRESYLDFAIDELNKDLYTKVTKVSDFIETEPYGDVEQDDFLNGCIEVETLRSPDELLKLINDIEKKAGRERIIHWGPRTLD
ncbi:MAG: dihydroneopterin aldolase, partial [Coprococcus sp.]